MSNDSTTQIIRRQRHLKTTIAGWLFPLALAVRHIKGAEVWGEILEAFGGVLIGSLAADASKEKISGLVDLAKATVGLNKAAVWLAGVALAFTVGCCSFRSRQTETTYDDGSVERETTVQARTFFNAKNKLASMSATTTDKTQGMKLGGLSQEADGSNVVNLVQAVTAGAVQGAVQGAAKVAKP